MTDQRSPDELAAVVKAEAEHYENNPDGDEWVEVPPPAPVRPDPRTLCANRTTVTSAATFLRVPGARGWIAACTACANVTMRDTWRETYDWADAHSSRGWVERRWIPHTITFARDENGDLVDTTPEGQ